MTAPSWTAWLVAVLPLGPLACAAVPHVPHAALEEPVVTTSESSPVLFRVEGDEVPPGPRRDRVAAVLRQRESDLEGAIAATGLPGLSMGVVVDGALVWTRSVGRTMGSMPTNGAPIDADTIFRVGSITKTFTGLALLKLRDEGKVALDEPLACYLPEAAELKYPTRDSAPVTLRELVTHASGLSRLGSPVALVSSHGAGASATETLAALPSMTFARAPGLGEASTYSNLGAALAGLVVERVSGSSYATYVARELLAPLGMARSGFSAQGVGNVASGLVRNGETWEPGEPAPLGAFDAAGGLSSSVADLARYVAFELAAWPPRDDDDPGPVRRSTVRESQLVGGYQRPSTDGFGVFWRLGRRHGAPDVVEHNGALLDGFSSDLAMIPSRGVGVVVLSSGYDARASAPVERLADTLLEAIIPATSPQFDDETADAVRRLVALGASWDEATARRLFAPEFLAGIPLEQVRVLLTSLVQRGPCVARELSTAGPGEWSFRLACDGRTRELRVALAPSSSGSGAIGLLAVASAAAHEGSEFR